MRTISMTVAYDGTEFHGWQFQPGQRTVQGMLEEALDRLPLTRLSRLAGAGRTDAGVHARGQVVSFRAVGEVPVHALPPLLARQLPPEVRVLEAREEDEAFHARHSAVARRYSYRLLRRPDVLWRRFAWCPTPAPDPAGLAAAMSALEGEHDFSAFRASGAAPGSAICRVHRATWTAWESGWRLDVISTRFLYHMVRNLVGTAVKLSRTPEPRAAMLRILGSRSRGQAGVTAPAQGLTLEQVFYERAGGA